MGAEDAAKKLCPDQLTFSSECDEHICGARAAWRKGFVKGHAEGRREGIEEVLLLLRTDNPNEQSDIADWLEEKLKEKDEK